MTERYSEPLSANAWYGSTGYEPLNEIIDGYHQGDLAVIAGRPGSGAESLLMSSVSQCAIKSKRRILVVSPRDTGSVFSRKLICNMGSIPHRHMVDGSLSEEDWPRVTSAITLLADAVLHIDDSPSFDPSEMIGRLEESIKAHSIQLVYINSLEYFSPSKKESMDISRFVRELKRVARTSGVAISCCLNLASESRGVNLPPSLADLGSWRQAEHDIDVLILIRSGVLWGAELDVRGEINVVKNPRGNVGALQFTHDQDSYRINDQSDI